MGKDIYKKSVIARSVQMSKCSVILKVDLNEGFQANNGTRIHQVSVVVPRSVIRQKSCAKRAEADPGSSISTKSIGFEAENGE